MKKLKTILTIFIPICVSILALLSALRWHNNGITILINVAIFIWFLALAKKWRKSNGNIRNNPYITHSYMGLET